MQTNYDIDVAEESNHEDNNNLPEFVDSECCSPQQLLLQNHHHRYSLHHYYPNQPVQPWQYRASEQERVLKLSCYYQSQLPQVLNFKLGLNQNSTTSATATGSANNNNNADAVQVHHQFFNHNHYFPEKQTHYVPKNRRQAEEYSIPKEPFCFADNNSKDSYSLNELDAIYNLAKISDNNNDIIIDSKLSEKKKKKKRKRRRRRRRKEVILLSSMSRFFKGLVEKIVSHQDRLHESFLESMDRMERERIKREEEWKIEEARWHSREAIARVHEQAQALNREEVIVSHIETITGQRLNFPI